MDTYRSHAVRLTRLAVLLVGEADAHDLVVDAVWRSITSRSWHRVSSPGAFLTTAVVNLAHDRRRSLARRRRREQAARPAVEIADHGLDVERRLTVRAALASLSPSQLAVVYLHYWEDLTLEATAVELDLAIGTVRSHLDRAKRKLRPLLPDFDKEHR